MLETGRKFKTVSAKVMAKENLIMRETREEQPVHQCCI